MQEAGGERGPRDLFALIPCVDFASLAPLRSGECLVGIHAENLIVQEELFEQVDVTAFQRAMELTGEPFQAADETVDIESTISQVRLPQAM